MSDPVSTTATGMDAPKDDLARTDDPERSGRLLDVRDLVVRYGGVRAVNGASLRIDGPEIVGLIGPNGAGKSSALGAIGGQVPTAGGTIRFDGRDITRMPPHKRARNGIVRTFQTASVFDGLTVFENVLLSGEGHTGASLSRAMFGGAGTRRALKDAALDAYRLLEEFELLHMVDNYGRELSGGQRRLVEVVRCLMRSPRLLLLDEPMVGVAPHLVERIGAALHRIRDSGVAIIIVEHAMEVVETSCDRVVVMAEGRVLADDSFSSVVTMQSVKDAYLA